MDHNLTSKDICNIIKQCSYSGVTHFNFGDLQISFKQSQLKAEENSITPGTEILGDELSQAEETATIQNEVQTREEQLEEMLLTDPLQFEELIRNGELEDDSE